MRKVMSRAGKRRSLVSNNKADLEGNRQEGCFTALDSTQTAPVVVQLSNFGSSIPLRRDQMPKHCDRVKQGFPAVEAKEIVGQS